MYNDPVSQVRGEIEKVKPNPISPTPDITSFRY